MSKYIKILVIFGLICLCFFASIRSIHAATLPTFSTCPNPNGEVVVSYSEGIHGIIGDEQTHSGSDSVYKISSNAFVQCYCPIQGEDGTDGVQTNWLNVSNLSQEEVSNLEGNGWIYVANGADWGLDNAPYLAQNISFSCGGGNTPTPTPIDVCKNIDGIQTSVPDTYHLAGDNCLQWELGGAPTPGPAGSALGASTSTTITGTGTGGQVLGISTLADTGNDKTFIRAILAVLVSVGMFFILVCL